MSNNPALDALGLYRRTDPETSREAAERLVASGKLTEQQREVYEALCRFPGSSTKALAQKAGLDRHTVARRMSELFTMKEVYKQGRDRDGMLYFPAGRQMEIE